VVAVNNHDVMMVVRMHDHDVVMMLDDHCPGVSRRGGN